MACTNHPDQVIDLVHCSRCGGEFCRDCVVEMKENLFCANCKREQVRDIQSGADTTALDLASIWRRFWALSLDGLITGIPTGAIGLLIFFAMFERSLETLAEAGNNLKFTLIFLVAGNAIWLIYEGLMLSSRGQTLGKMALGIKVVTPEGEDINPSQAWGRTFVRVVFNAANALFGLLTLVNYLPAFFSKEKKAVHDSMAKTRVVNWRG